MTVETGYIEISTQGKQEVCDITGDLTRLIQKCGISNGIAAVFVSGSTAALTTIEYEPGLKKDMADFLERIVPYKGRYFHHETWHDDNGSSHIQAAMLGPSLTVPFVQGTLTLGTWQQVVLIDCDTRPRKRKLVVQIMGE